MSDQDVIASQVATRYAVALYELSEEAKSLKAVEKDVKTLRSLFAKHTDLQRLITNPVFATEDKVSALTAIAKKAKLGKLAIQFVGLVAQNHRADELPSILAAYQDIAMRKRGAQIAKVSSATKLSTAQITSLKTQLKKSLGRAVDIEIRVDPDLLGGFVVQIGSRLYDSSLKTQLEDLKLTLKDA